MVLILDGNSEIGAHLSSNLCYLICVRHLFRSRAVTNLINNRFDVIHTCVIRSELPSDISTMGIDKYTYSKYLLLPDKVRVERIISSPPIYTRINPTSSRDFGTGLHLGAPTHKYLSARGIYSMVRGGGGAAKEKINKMKVHGKKRAREKGGNCIKNGVIFVVVINL